tara:strand:- start:48818 stop:49444 length:627 start_codon:yes stop_codon:yes gene_type:complete
MYIPAHYRNENLSEVKEFLERNSFGILVSQVAGRPWATHIPLELVTNENGKDLLLGHVSKANPQWKHLGESEHVLAIFNGPHSYISSSWYHKEEVPTWNYIAVHVYGKIKILGAGALMESLHQLVDKYEAHSKNPVSLHNLSAKTLRQVNGIIGLEIEITEIQAAYKLSQGREEDHPKILNSLEESGDPGAKGIATAMRNNTDRNPEN